jgi:hypothetical protein
MSGPIGVSGTREGMNVAQRLEVEQILESAFDLSGGVLLHGDCHGVDEEVHRIAVRLGYYVKAFPPSNPKHRAFVPDADEYAEPMPYLDRDRAIVDAAGSMLIIPLTAEEDAPRSGTWYTYRYAIERRKPVTVIPGGRFEFDAESDPEGGPDLHLRVSGQPTLWELPAPGES